MARPATFSCTTSIIHLCHFRFHVLIHLLLRTRWTVWKIVADRGLEPDGVGRLVAAGRVGLLSCLAGRPGLEGEK